MTNKIEKYGLTQIVKDLRKTLSHENTAKVINEKYLPNDAEPINAMTVYRFEKREELISLPTEKRKSDALMPGIVNTYDDMVTLRNRTERYLQNLNKEIQDLRKNVRLEEFQNDQEYIAALTTLSNSYERAIARKQSITNDITKYQKDLMRHDNIKRVLDFIVRELQKEPEIYARIMQVITEDRELFDLLRSL